LQVWQVDLSAAILLDEKRENVSVEDDPFHAAESFRL